LPLLGDEGQDVADQKEIEEIQQIGEVSREDELPLVGREPLLALQEVQHEVHPSVPAWIVAIAGPPPIRSCGPRHERCVARGWTDITRSGRIEG
jgi:hypothetical protein